MDTDRFINIAICMAIAVVILTTVAVPVMTLHRSEQIVYNNEEGMNSQYGRSSPSDSISIKGNTTYGTNIYVNGTMYDLTDILVDTQRMPVLVCDAGYLVVQLSGGLVYWELYMYSESVETAGLEITDHIAIFTRIQYPDSSFNLDVSVENSVLSVDIQDGPGQIRRTFESPVRLGSFVYDSDGEYVSRTDWYTHPLVWSDYYLFTSYYAPGFGWDSNQDPIIWKPNGEVISLDVPYKDLGGGAKSTNGVSTITYSIDGVESSREVFPNYWVVPLTVNGEKTQGVDDPAVIYMVAIIPLIIALSLIIYLGRNIFNKE